MIEIAQLECKISVLEYSDTFEATKKYLHEGNTLGHAYSKWESFNNHRVKFSNDHEFPQSMEPIRQYFKTNTQIVNNIVNNIDDSTNQSNISTHEAPKILYKKKLTKAEKKANPTIVETNPNKGPKAKPAPEALNLDLPKRYAKAAPVDHAAKHANHLKERIDQLEKELARKGKVVQ